MSDRQMISDEYLSRLVSAVNAHGKKALNEALRAHLQRTDRRLDTMDFESAELDLRDLERPGLVLVFPGGERVTAYFPIIGPTPVKQHASDAEQFDPMLTLAVAAALAPERPARHLGWLCARGAWLLLTAMTMVIR